MIKKLLCLVLLTTLCIAGGQSVARADVNDFTVNNFRADYLIGNDKTGGSLATIETIDLTFTDQNHGILRALPQKYQGFKTKLKVQLVQRDGVKEQFTTYTQNNNLVLKIGDPNKTITGKHTYEIVYTQERIINFSNGQTFYWDVNGTDWGQPFEHVEAYIRTADKPLSPDVTSCYTGVLRSQDKACASTIEGDAVHVQTTAPLPAGSNLSVEMPITNMTFTQPTTRDRLLDHAAIIAGGVLGLLAVFSAFIVWMRVGRDYSGRGVIIPEYEVPKGLTPAELGMLADYKVDGRDVSATLVDLAVRGYIRIHQDVKKILFFKSQTFTLELLKGETSSLKDHEKELLNALFPSLIVGEKMPLTSIDRSRMQKAMVEIRKDMKTSLVDTYGLIEPESHKAQLWMQISGGVALFGGFFVIGLFAPLAVVLIMGGAAYLLFGFIAQRRSHAGVEVYEQIKGLELYMNTAEKDRLKMMQSVDRPFAEPTKTVELFEKLLPFAVALGVEKSWAKQFDDILTKAPSWYSNSAGTFNSTALASGLSSATSSFSQSFEASSGSGSSGGGSGGGGGGGGGGGW